MTCSCGAWLIVVQDAGDESSCCERGLKLICPHCSLPNISNLPQERRFGPDRLIGQVAE